MYKRKKRNNKKLITVFSIVIVIVLLFVSITTNRKVGFIENIFKDVLMFTNKVFTLPVKENDQDESYLIQKNINSSLEREIEELKDTLNLNKTLTEYKKVNASVLSRNKSYWFNTITIDKGSIDGIKKDMIVITKNGLVGKIYKTSENSSEVKLITSDDVNYKVSVSLTTSTGDTFAILNGYDHDRGLLTVTGVDKTHTIEIGDRVVTSGLGGKEPRGIYIGEVKDIKSDKYNLSKTIYLSTGQDFDNIHYLTVLKEHN